MDAVDWQDQPPGKDADYDFESYATAPDAKARLAALTDPKRGAQESAVLGRTTMGGFLAYLNSPAHLGEKNSEYFDFAMLGDDGKAPGANWVGAWHTRNLRIFAKLVRIADRPNDRVLVIYGAGRPSAQSLCDRESCFSDRTANRVAPARRRWTSQSRG